LLVLNPIFSIASGFSRVCRPIFSNDNSILIDLSKIRTTGELSRAILDASLTNENLSAKIIYTDEMLIENRDQLVTDFLNSLKVESQIYHSNNGREFKLSPPIQFWPGVDGYIVDFGNGRLVFIKYE
ncbi:MAG TPA: hypothetical protein PLJ21_02425, partial [Pseudobdellovibrionaceae bacterium]|nr:hypothetical protein [Pseudobdellovibrionaceae bacterium]